MPFTFDPSTRYPLSTEHAADYDITDLLAADHQTGPVAILVIARHEAGTTADGQAAVADAFLVYRAEDDGRGYSRLVARYTTTEHPAACRTGADVPRLVTPTPEGSAEVHAGGLAASLHLPLVWADTRCTGQLAPTYTVADDQPADMTVAHDAAHAGRPCPVHHAAKVST